MSASTISDTCPFCEGILKRSALKSHITRKHALAKYVKGYQAAGSTS